MTDIGKLRQVSGAHIHIVGVQVNDPLHIVNVNPGAGMVPTGGLPRGGAAGDLLAKKNNADYAVEWITPASSAEKDNTRPITAAAVYTEIGNINALLATI